MRELLAGILEALIHQPTEKTPHPSLVACSVTIKPAPLSPRPYLGPKRKRSPEHYRNRYVKRKVRQLY